MPTPLPPAEFCCDRLLDLAKQVEELSLGVLHPAFAPIEHIERQLRAYLPSDIHVRASQQLGISLTRWPDGRNVIITDFATREELIQVRGLGTSGPVAGGGTPAPTRVTFGHSRGQEHLQGGGGVAGGCSELAALSLFTKQRGGGQVRMDR